MGKGALVCFVLLALSPSVAPQLTGVDRTLQSYTITTAAPCEDNPDSACWTRPLSDCGGIYEPWSRAHCPMRCGYCPGQKPPCEDATDSCNRYGDDACTSNLYRIWARENCRKFCSFCSVSDEPHCIVQERLIAQSEWLQMDCHTFCFCQDARQNVSTCLDSCPSYGNCTVTPPAEGECCGQPVGSEPECQPVTSQASTCDYKGTTYQDGETWEDNCEFHCLCRTGTSLCSNKCVDEYLPAGCHAEAATPGTCCPVHVCAQGSRPVVVG